MAHETSNLLLDALPANQRTALVARMQPVSLPTRTMLCNPGEQPKYAHFMTSGIASVVTFMANGVGAEVGMIGREGVVEGIHLLGPAKTPTSSFIQVEGTALRIRFSELQDELFKPGALLKQILEFVQTHGFILSQLAACHGLHEIEGRLARWLLMVQDRVRSEKFYLTQEFLAEMLGTRRTSVSASAGSLHKTGLIDYKRGHIRILDRAGLETAACECYPIVRSLAQALNPRD
jgi:CRP-like cAMP-binding protein